MKCFWRSHCWYRKFLYPNGEVTYGCRHCDEEKLAIKFRAHSLLVDDDLVLRKGDSVNVAIAKIVTRLEALETSAAKLAELLKSD